MTVDHNAIMQVYDTRRRDAEAALRQRETAIRKAIPALFERRAALKAEMADAARKTLLGAEPTDFSKQIEKQKKWEHKALKEKGYPADYLDRRYVCTLCHDTGYVGDMLRSPCQCHRQLVVDALCRASHMAHLDRENFDTFDPKCIPDEQVKGKLTQREHLTRIRDQLEAYTQAFPGNDKILVLLFGPTGLGKTFLLNCMGKAILDRGYTVVRVSAFQLAEYFVQSMFDKDTPVSLDTLAQADVLILDDLGTEVIRHNSTLEWLYNLINHRIHEGKHLFISTNLSLAELKQRYFERFTSRLFGNQSLILEFLGKDIRLHNK